MLRRLVVLGMVWLVGCEGRVGELGEAEAENGVQTVFIRDRSGPQVNLTCAAETVETRHPLPCTIVATHPTQEPMSCLLSFNDGRPDVTIDDCSAVTTRDIVSSSPGPLRITVSVRDASNRVTTKGIDISVTGQPNQAPVLSLVSAAPTSGKTPLLTSLRWAVRDPESDPMTCAIDENADGTIEHAAVDCGSGQFPLTLITPGSTVVRLIATDSGALSAQAQVTLEVLPPTADLQVQRVEFGQSVVKEGLELVAEKPALLRVIVLGNEPGLVAELEVEASRGTTVLGNQRLTGPAVAPTAETPADLSKSYRFVMPREWIAPGLVLRVIVDGANRVAEIDETNNQLTLTPAVSPAREVHLTSVPVVNGGDTGATPDLNDTLTGIYPVTSVETKVRAPFTWTQTIDPADSGSWAALLGGLAQARASDGSERNYYGWVPANFGGGVAGIGYVGRGVGTGRDDSRNVAAHELGHNFGRNHAPCGGAGGADPSYPYANGRIGTSGWNGSQLLSPTQWVDLMSYCNPGWVSDYTYEGVRDFMARGNEFEPGAMLPSVVGDDVVMFAGRLTPRGVVLADPQRFHGRTTRAVEASTAAVVLTLVDGRVVRVPVELVATSEGDELHFVTVVRWPGEWLAWAVEREGAVNAQRTALADAFAPKFQVERVGASVLVTWTGARTAMVAHVAPTGERTTLTVEARGGRVTLSPPSAEGHLELSFSDGVRTFRSPWSSDQPRP